MMEPIELAEVAYRGYAAHTDGKTFDGCDMPVWEDLPERTVDAWIAAVDAVLKARARNVTVHITGSVVSDGELSETIRREVSNYRKRNP